MKNNNLLLAIATIFGFLLLWNRFVASRYAPAPDSQKKTFSAPAAPAERAPVASSTLPPTAKSPDFPTTTVLRADNVEVVMESQGARVKSWRIKEREHWVELAMPQKEGSPAPLETFPELNFSVTHRFVFLDYQGRDKSGLAPEREDEVVFTADHPDGFRLTKTVRLLSKPPFHSVTFSAVNLTKSNLKVELPIFWGEGLNKKVEKPGAEVDVNSFKPEERAVGYSDKIWAWRSGFFKSAEEAVQTANFQWVGVDNSHFVAAFLPDSESRTIGIVKAIFPKKSFPSMEIPVEFDLKPGETKSVAVNLYVGPKKYDELRKIGHGLEKCVDFGFFGPIALVLLRTLQTFEKLTGNYGWAIVLLTICIQIVVFPLTRKSLQHSVKMKDLQPQLKKLQEQFKGDPKRLQVEQLNLFKKNGMKFMGMEGCFPMLLQIPIFIAFYATLRVAYELRGAPWIWWVTDLSVHDPKYILPVLMGLGMFLQQKLTNVSADPAQARMMMFMPVMFTFMFLKLPAGLVLYWLVNSMMTIAIQKVLVWRGHAVPSPAPGA